jgi:transglutaminase-like putative cysteine protease
MSTTLRTPSPMPSPVPAGPTAPRTPNSRPARPAEPRPSAAAGARSAGFVLLALAIALGSLSSVLDGALWWGVSVVAMAVVLGAASITRAFLRARGWGTVAGVVAGIIAITVFFAADTAWGGVIPTPDTWERFVRLTADAQQSISVQSIPADAGGGILFLLCWVSAAFAVILDALVVWWRVPALAGLPLVVVLCVPGSIRPELTNPLYFAATAVAYLLLLRQTSRRSRPSVTVGLGSVAVLGALLLPVVLPPVLGESGGSGGSSLAAGINPIITLGDDLRRGETTVALSYSTTSPNGEYLRLTTLEEFDGDQWEPINTDPIAGNDVADFGDAPGLTPEVRTEPAVTSVEINNATGRWLPVPYPATSVTGLTGDWSWEPNGLSVRTDGSNMRGQAYEVQSLDLHPTSDQLEAAPSSADNPLAAVPEGLDPIVAETAAAVVAGETTDYGRAEALQDWFRSGEFRYSEEAPVDDGFDGSGLDVLAPFLEAKAGYCVHFSSAMAVMARTLDIPSRVVVGFLPGEESSGATQEFDESDLAATAAFTVTSRDLHAWPELYFDGVGWVRFEPTPGRGIEPIYLPAPVDNPSTPDIDESQPTAAPPPTAAPVETSTPTPTPTAGAIGTAGDDTTALSGWVFVSAAAALLLLALPGSARVAKRSRRYAAVRRRDRPATAAWREIVDTAHDLGLPSQATSTPRDLAGRLGSAAALSTDALAALTSVRAALENEAYSREGSGSGVTPETLTVVLRALRRGVDVPDRIRAFLFPVTSFDALQITRLAASSRWALAARRR